MLLNLNFPVTNPLAISVINWLASPAATPTNAAIATAPSQNVAIASATTTTTANTAKPTTSISLMLSTSQLPALFNPSHTFSNPFFHIPASNMNILCKILP